MHTLTGSSGILVVLLLAMVLLAALLGWTLLRTRSARSGRRPAARQLPQQWPLNPRPLVNSGERHVWRWLGQVFPDHHIMVKLPLTRFTMPRQAGEGREWFELLSTAYCTFTLCDDSGRVVGCVDVPGPQPMARGNRQLKHTLLAQCGIGYVVVSPRSLSDGNDLRTEFLGLFHNAPAPADATVTERQRLDEVRHQLHEALDRNRLQRHLPESGDGRAWPQADSFLGALDSRHVPLEPVPTAPAPVPLRSSGKATTTARRAVTAPVG